MPDSSATTTAEKTITITFDPTAVVKEPETAALPHQIAPVFMPDNSYVDTDVYDSDKDVRKKLFAGAYASADAVPNTVHFDTNVYDKIGLPGFLEAYLGSISAAPTTLALFKAAFDKSVEAHKADATGADYKGVATVTESDPKKIENIAEIGKALAKFGFSVTGADVATATKIDA